MSYLIRTEKCLNFHSQQVRDLFDNITYRSNFSRFRKNVLGQNCAIYYKYILCVHDRVKGTKGFGHEIIEQSHTFTFSLKNHLDL